MVSGGQVGDSLVSKELEPSQGTGQGRTQETVVLAGGSQSTEQSRPQGLKWASERSEMFKAKEPPSVLDSFSRSSFTWDLE